MPTSKSGPPLDLKQLKHELSSEEFSKIYDQLRQEHPLLSPFPTPFSLIDFFRAQTKDHATENSILREEQTKTIFNRLDDYRELSVKLHKEHFDATERLNHSRAEGWRSFDVRISQHDVVLKSIHEDLANTCKTVEQQSQAMSRTKGIAIGLGMAGGAIVSILAILAQLIK